MIRRTVVVALVLVALAACAEESPVADADLGNGSGPASESSAPEQPEGEAPAEAQPSRVDPRKGGVDVGLGEWAVTPEVKAIRPGRVVFVIHNRGTVPHGFEIELEGDSSGSGSGDLFKAESELLQPGESTRLSVNLAAATYKYECLVDGHDDLGMEGFLEVRDDAPKVKVEAGGGRGAVAIAEFAFSPTLVQVDAGTAVTWDNVDPTAHTVTALKGEFDSGTMESGDSFKHTFTKPGTYQYRCNIHPTMKGTVKVE